MDRKKLAPELRFEGFNNISDSKRLEELVRIRKSNLYSNSSNPKGKYKFFNCGRTSTYTDNYGFDTEALLIAGAGDIGHVRYYKGKFNTYKEVYVLDKFELDPIFLKGFIEKNFPRIVYKQKNAGAIPHIINPTLYNFEIKYPSIEEQKRIGNFLSKVDKRIKLLEEIKDLKKQYKKGLLQQMFVSKSAGGGY